MNGGLDVDATQEVPIIGHEPSDRDEPAGRRAERPNRSGGSQRRRVSKWDRPPPPKDWRYFVNGLGQIFIALGLLIFGFVGYQLWGTGIETARTQNELGADFQQQLIERQLVEEPTPEAVAVPVAELPEEVRPVDPEITEVIPVEEQSHLEIVDPGTAIAKIEIPKIGVESYVLPTVGRDDLKKGVGHFPETSQAGQLGNAAYAGHRTTYGGPFYELDELGVGDRVIITRSDGNRYTYAVTDTEVVHPDGFNINNRLDPQLAQLTLMTCTPVHSAVNRLIIYGELVPSESGPVGESTFYRVRTVTNEVAVSDAEAATATTTGPVATDATATSELPAARPVDTPQTTLATDAASGLTPTTVPDETVFDDPQELPDDGWSAGWFEDSAAWPQIAMWGAGVLGLFILFRLVSRWTRHYSIGFLLCVAPFLVCLYFFYQNLNRLLPAGI